MALKIKNSMSWLDLKTWLTRYREVIVGSYIDNIYWGGGSKFIFKLRPLKGDVKFLIVEPGRRIHFTRYRFEKIAITGEITALRRRIRGRRIEDAEMLGLERIIKLKLRNRSLIVELLPRGIMAVLDGEGVVEFSTEYREMRDRSILKGLKYEPPPSRSLSVGGVGVEEFYTLCGRGKDLVRGLVLGLGLPSEVAEEAVYRAGVDKRLKPKELDEEEVVRLLGKVKEVEEEALRGRGFIVKKGDSLLTVTPFKPGFVEGEYEVLEYSEFNDALDDYFHSLELYAPKVGEPGELEKLKKAIRDQERILEEVLERSKNLRRIGEELLSKPDKYFYLQECADRLLRNKDAKCLEVLKVKFMDRKKGVLKVEFQGVELEFYTGDTIYKVASRLHSNAKKLEEKAEKVKKAIEELKRKIVEEEASAKERIISWKVKRRPINWYERYHWIICDDGTLIIGGRDRHQNDAIVKKYLGEEDVFVHADIRGAPAVIIKCKGRPSESSLREAAILAASYSKAWRERIGSVDVFWVYGRQVSKSPPPGEYLAKGSFMIYGRKNYLRNVELKLALGVEVFEEGYVRIIVGSEDNVSKKTKYYFLLSPGETSKEELANRIKKILSERVEESLKPLMKSVSIEEILSKIPGPSRIIGVSGALKW